MNRFVCICLFSVISMHVWAQTPSDSLETIELDEVEIRGYRPLIEPVSPLPSLHQTYIMAGKKSEVISLKNMPANLAEKTGRQIFAKIPGIFVYDMDGSGNQVNIATRGLDAHRSWEYNIRQNNVIINSDMYGYPASHYSVPMEAIDRIEMVRGTASLQYGAQFGGMINYVIKKADTTKRISYENLTSVGSYGLFSSYNAIGGKIGKFTYYAYYHKRISDGYRNNSASDATATFVSLQYTFHPKLTLKAELGRSTYQYQLPGPLTDSMFRADPRQSTRARNYFNPDIYVPSITLDWKLGQHTALNLVSSAVLGERNSVLFDNFATVADKIDTLTHQYTPRIVDIDNFNSYTTELRLLHQYKIGGLSGVVAAGIRYMHNDMRRRQRGKGTTGTDFDLTVEDTYFGRDMHFRTKNTALFVENLLYITPGFKITPGMRYENGTTHMNGYISYLEEQEVPNRIRHSFPLFGIALEYSLPTQGRLYGGISQSYRPVLFKDIIPGSVLEKVGKNLKDARGYTAEVGISGQLKKRLRYDLSLFRLQYNNRMGSMLETSSGTSYIYKTNIGNSISNGIELLVEAAIIQSKTTHLKVFTSTSYIDARYEKAIIVSRGENVTISGNRVESVPRWISRNGMEFSYKTFSGRLQYNYVGESFADPINTITPSANGAVGLVPAYSLWDINMALQISQKYIVRIGVNNMLNTQYFTKRPLFYPGPGVWSSDGRSIVASVGIKI
ncbi:TonB-dependent receptor [Rhodocytophaga rosea]|uniref:TonB-dependent receptor n=1 Tax=Rhodocytophaga rosea TaxID=2704465 RepID=A0A6C0GE16_9BACT|nr:TonB-dependent receptor [Rhodocytophaga rosea]QHT66249.1 TonB-dependent receptor [Rhodocytophaga rosea]